MANVSMLAGLKMVGDRASGVASAAAAIVGMSVDSNTAFAAADTSVASTGGTPTNFQGNALDSVPTSPAAASPHVVTHLMTLTAGQYNGFIIKRVGLHNLNPPTNASNSLMFGIDGLSLTKAAAFSMTLTVKLSYS